MNDSTGVRTVTVSLAAIERDTGLTNDTLRMWERRYGFPQPRRDDQGECAYSLEELDKLRLVRRLMDQGFRPGKLISQSTEALQSLAEGVEAAPRSADRATGDDIERLLDCVVEHRLGEMRRLLSQALLRRGLARCVTEVLAPLTTLVGESWARGTLEIFEEHLYTEAVQSLLRGAMNAMASHGARPRVLLTTFPQEPHSLGVLMAEAMFTLEGARCVPLGAQMPLWQIAAAARANGVEIVALSFTPVVNPNQVLAGLADLRGQLPAPLEIWVGGSAPVLRRRPPPGVRVVESLTDIGPAVQAWRAQHQRAGMADDAPPY